MSDDMTVYVVHYWEVSTPEELRAFAQEYGLPDPDGRPVLDSAGIHVCGGSGQERRWFGCYLGKFDCVHDGNVLDGERLPQAVGAYLRQGLGGEGGVAYMTAFGLRHWMRVLEGMGNVRIEEFGEPRKAQKKV